MSIGSWLQQRSVLEALILSIMTTSTATALILTVRSIVLKQSAVKWVGEAFDINHELRGVSYKVTSRYGKALYKKNRCWVSMERKVLAFGKRILNWHVKRLVTSGMAGQKGSKLAKKWCFILAILSIAVLLSDIKHPTKALCVLIGLSAYFYLATHFKIKERQNIFVTGVYKIYRHMALQLTAGMSSAEVIKHLHESVEEPFLKEAMFGFSSCYFKTMDLELAVEELTKRIEGDEIHVLATVLRQGLQTGDPYEMVVKQEQLMVKRYYAALAEESEHIRIKGIGIAIALCLLVFLLLAIPMIYEMSRATQSIFSGQ